MARPRPGPGFFGLLRERPGRAGGWQPRFLLGLVRIESGGSSFELNRMEVAGPMFRKFADLITLTSIVIFGRPSERCCGSCMRRHDRWDGGL